jgi:ATP-dependent Clp protease ATP-binding subunit ClpX
MFKKNAPEPTCGFCSRTKSEVEILIQGATCFICEKCAPAASNVIYEELHKKDKPESPARISSLPILINELKKDFIGQDHILKNLATSIYLHSKKVKSDKIRPSYLNNNMILVGESGCGKSYLMNLISEKTDLPTVIVNASTYSQTGYVGEDVDSILSSLLKKAGGNVSKAQSGIVFIDNIDYIAIRPIQNKLITRDISGEGVQLDILELLSNSIINVAPEGGRKHPDQSFIPFDTTNLLFIASGKFNNMDKSRFSTGKINNSDIIEQGFLPELVNRFSRINYFTPYSTNDYKLMLEDTDNSILKHYKAFFVELGLEIEFTKDFVTHLAELTHKEKRGFYTIKNSLEDISLRLVDHLGGDENKKVSIGADFLKV